MKATLCDHCRQIANTSISGTFTIGLRKYSFDLCESCAKELYSFLNRNNGSIKSIDEQKEDFDIFLEKLGFKEDSDENNS